VDKCPPGPLPSGPVGILRALRLVDDTDRATASLATAQAFPSPLTTLPTDVAAAFGISAGTIETVTRSEAMSVPAVRRGRSIIAGGIGTLPLVATRVTGGEVERVTRPLLDQPNPDTTRAFVMTWTVDDLLFHGRSWWRVLGRDREDYPTSAERVGLDRVNIAWGEDARTGRRVGRVYVDGRHVPDRDLIRFDGPDEGLLATGGRTLRTAILLEQAVRRNSDGLPPQDLLALAEGATELSNAPGSAGIEGSDASEIDALLDEWQYARRTRGTAYVNRSIDHRIVGFDPKAMQLAEARQHQALEVARMLNLSADDVDAPGGTGMTYQNREARQRDRVDNTLRPYLASIYERLSMGDVTPRGTTVRFDLTEYLANDTAAAITAGREAVESGLMTTGEVRTDLLRRPPTLPADGTRSGPSTTTGDSPDA
jgi:phage portal protein BeeE